MLRRDRLEVELALGRRPVDLDVDDLAQNAVQGADQIRKLGGDQRRMGPPGAVDAARRQAGQREPGRAGGAA